MIPLVASAAILAIAAHGEGAGLFSHLSAMQERLQRMRAPYVWISLWQHGLAEAYVLLAASAVSAFWRIRERISIDLRIVLLGLVAIGLVSMPLSGILLERAHLAIVPQFQPMRAVLFIELAMQIFGAAAGAIAASERRWTRAFLWFALAYLPPLRPVMLDPFTWRQAVVIAAFAGATALARRWAPVVAAAAFFLIPTLGGVVNYPPVQTPELAELSSWARASTPRDAVFLFPAAGRGGEPGVFRSEALRAVYVDWKAGGQVNYLAGFGEQWWFRWQQTLARGFHETDLPRYGALGIQYVVLPPGYDLPQAPAFRNTKYAVYTASPDFHMR
jgi:hypothetical protein